MIKKKPGFFTFIFSFMPGLAEMYMGFYKMGISLLVMFWGIIALSAFTNIDVILFLVPIVWFYGFFHAHGLAGMRDEEFYQMEDVYLIPFINDEKAKEFLSGKRGRVVLAWVLIIMGISVIWSNLSRMFGNVLLEMFPGVYDMFDLSVRRVPQVVIAILLIILGIKLIQGKKEELNQEKIIQEKEEEKHD